MLCISLVLTAPLFGLRSPDPDPDPRIAAAIETLGGIAACSQMGGGSDRSGADAQPDCLPFQVPFNCVEESTHFIGPGERKKSQAWNFRFFLDYCSEVACTVLPINLCPAIKNYKSPSKSISIVSSRRRRCGGWESSTPAPVRRRTHLSSLISSN